MPAGASARLHGLGILLPPPPPAKGSYVPVARAGGFAYVAGQIVTEEGRVVSPGSVDGEVRVDVAKELARRATLQALSALQHELGSLDRIERIVRVIVYVASSPGFVKQHEVANGATDVLVDIFGEIGRPARAAVGVTALPLGAAVEVELVAAVE
jgi:enamine deaminase RidA (YjgF/YER057c/UK114 family)